jgi:hypothetical protein
VARKEDPDNFRSVWISFFGMLAISGGLGFASVDTGHDDLLLGVAFVVGPLLVIASLRGFANRVQRRLDRERERGSHEG